MVMMMITMVMMMMMVRVMVVMAMMVMIMVMVMVVMMMMVMVDDGDDDDDYGPDDGSHHRFKLITDQFETATTITTSIMSASPPFTVLLVIVTVVFTISQSPAYGQYDPRDHHWHHHHHHHDIIPTQCHHYRRLHCLRKPSMPFVIDGRAKNYSTSPDASRQSPMCRPP